MGSDRLRRALASMTGTFPHPSILDLGTYLRGDRRPETEAHLAACDPCREALANLHRRRRLRTPVWAAAALLLLTAGILWPHPRVRAISPPPSPAPLSAPEALPGPGGVWTQGEVLAGRSVLMTLSEGGRARLSGSSPVTVVLERGILRVESPGEETVLEAGDLRVALQDGELLAEVRPSPSGPGAWLLRDAWAGEAGEVRVTLLSGSARIGDRTLRAGESLGEPISRPESGAWIPLDSGSGSLREESRTLLPSPPSGYVFETLIRKRQASAELGVRFETPGRGWEVLVGNNLLPPGEGWSRLRVTVDVSNSRVVLGGRPVSCLPLPELGRKLLGSPKDGVGLRAWGGAVEIRSARWRPLS